MDRSTRLETSAPALLAGRVPPTGEYPTGYSPVVLHVESHIWLRSYERRGNQLNLIVLKPHGLLQLCSFYSHKIKTKRLITIIKNTIDLADDSLPSAKGAVVRYSYQTAYGKDVIYPNCSDLLSLVLFATQTCSKT